MAKADMSSNTSRPVHGGLNVAELESLGLCPDDVIDFSASINPLGPPPKALEAAQSVNLAAYPDPECTKLREAIGAALTVDTGRVLVGNGSTELIHLLARAYLRPGGIAAVFAPTFGEYVAACRTEGVEPIAITPSQSEVPKSAFQWDIPAACDRIANLQPAIVFLCNPNNPTGVYLRQQEVRSVAESMQGVGLLVLDEAYVSFVDAPWDAMPLLSLGNVVLLRSMTKDYALTGLRLGYMLAPPSVIERARSYQYSWSVNAPAQAAGIAALSESSHLELGRQAVREGKSFLLQTAESLGIQSAPSTANFLLLKVGRATEIRRKLLTRHGVCVRDCTSFGLPEHIRVGVRQMDDNRRLAAALEQVLGPRQCRG